MDLPMLRDSDDLEVLKTVVEEIAILVMHVVAIRYRSVMELPNSDVKRDFLPIPIGSPSPEVPLAMFLLGVWVSAKHPPVEYHCFSGWLVLVDSATNCFW